MHQTLQEAHRGKHESERASEQPSFKNSGLIISGEIFNIKKVIQVKGVLKVVVVVVLVVVVVVLAMSLVTCSAEDMKQVLPRLARPQAGWKGKDDRGGMPERTVKGG